MDIKNKKLKNNTIPKPINTTISEKTQTLKISEENNSTKTKQKYDLTNNSTRLE